MHVLGHTWKHIYAKNWLFENKPQCDIHGFKTRKQNIIENKPMDIAAGLMNDKSQCKVCIVEIHLIWMIFAGKYTIFFLPRHIFPSVSYRKNDTKHDHSWKTYVYAIQQLSMWAILDLLLYDYFPKTLHQM